MIELSFMTKLWIVLGTVIVTAVIGTAWVLAKKPRKTDSIGDAAQDAIAASANPIATAEKWLFEAVSYRSALRLVPQVQISALMLLLLWVNDLIFGFGTIGGIFPIENPFYKYAVAAFFAFGPLLIDTSTYNAMLSAPADMTKMLLTAKAKLFLLIIVGYGTTIFMAWANGGAMQDSFKHSSVDTSDEYQSAKDERKEVAQSKKSLNTSIIQQQALLSRTKQNVAREFLPKCISQPERCPKWSEYKALELSQSAALGTMQGQYANFQNRYDDLNANIGDKKSSGQTAASKNIAEFINLAWLLALFLFAISLQWLSAVPAFQEFTTARLHSVAQKIRDELGEDILKKAALKLPVVYQKTALESVDFADIETVQQIVINNTLDTAKSPQHRDILRLFETGYIIKSENDALSIKEVSRAYSNLPIERREGHAMTDMAAIAVIRDALRYVPDAKLTSDGIEGWKLNLSMVVGT